IASEAGLPKHREDFGQTLGKWGGEPGPYVVLPLLGPSTVRDTIALPADFLGDPWGYKYPVDIRNIGYGVRVLDRRAGALDATGLVEEAALDKYEFVRDAYLQRRESLIHDNGEQPAPAYDGDASLKQKTGPQPANALSSSFQPQ
ncbi:MAG: MlaA family lipoprotein, partial [Burkholderiaceae bacterium]|nr:MlaA family lipoprotein [Burkholderiaceae bacterium]